MQDSTPQRQLCGSSFALTSLKEMCHSIIIRRVAQGTALLLFVVITSGSWIPKVYPPSSVVSTLLDDPMVTTAQGSKRKQAERTVVEYMKSTTPGYKPGAFREFFEQHPKYGEEIAGLLNSTKVVKYSLSHDYHVGGKAIKLDYFHFDAGMHLVGRLSYEQMLMLTIRDLGMDTAIMRSKD